MILANKTLLKRFSNHLRSFSDFTVNSELKNSQSILICRDENQKYFQKYCEKNIPPEFSPLIIPFSKSETYKYPDNTIESSFKPLLNFYTISTKEKMLNDCCENLLFSPITTTTQTILEKYYARSEHNIMYFAKKMTQGKGRAKNEWESHDGGLMFSFVTKGNIKDCLYFPYIDSLCLIKAIKPFIPKATLKWPNDVYIEGKKTAGLICNATKATDGSTCTIHGTNI